MLLGAVALGWLLFVALLASPPVDHRRLDGLSLAPGTVVEVTHGGDWRVVQAGGTHQVEPWVLATSPVLLGVCGVLLSIVGFRLWRAGSPNQMVQQTGGGL
jgi:hypothetical protein